MRYETWGAYEYFGARNRYLEHGEIITSHRILWDVITSPYAMYLLLAPSSSYIHMPVVIRVVLSNCCDTVETACHIEMRTNSCHKLAGISIRIFLISFLFPTIYPVPRCFFVTGWINESLYLNTTKCTNTVYWCVASKWKALRNLFVDE